uniref:Uncharacterized protein n=1 Tax=Oryza glumipatula TaxID=40148 RepID=A0A0E0ASA9_9ORYZ
MGTQYIILDMGGRRRWCLPGFGLPRHGDEWIRDHLRTLPNRAEAHLGVRNRRGEPVARLGEGGGDLLDDGNLVRSIGHLASRNLDITPAQQLGWTCIGSTGTAKRRAAVLQMPRTTTGATPCAQPVPKGNKKDMDRSGMERRSSIFLHITVYSSKYIWASIESVLDIITWVVSFWDEVSCCRIEPSAIALSTL